MQGAGLGQRADVFAQQGVRVALFNGARLNFEFNEGSDVRGQGPVLGSKEGKLFDEFIHNI
jgi:hypothetical protein